jgi:FkbM family methyltransferase
LKTVKNLLKIIRYINGHPLAGRHRWLGYYRLFQWQFYSRVSASPRLVPFTAKTRLLVSRGMTGATGNIYTGLHDFPEMAFLLHFLRSRDQFMDIGANVGSYTVLASAHVGCRTLSFEPVPETVKALRANIELNSAEDRVTLVAAAVGSVPGRVKITASLDTVNHIVQEGGADLVGTREVPVVTADSYGEGWGIPILVKIDVEGFEWEVLQGAEAILANPELKALIIELNGSGERYGYSEERIHEKLLGAGFQPYQYDPFTRHLTALATHGALNTIYLRDPEAVQIRLASAPAVTLFRETF